MKWRCGKPFHRQGAYDGFDRLSELAPHYRRCRTVKNFILSRSGIEAERPVCSVCRQPITPDQPANRGIYYPRRSGRSRRWVIMHYECAWSALFKAVLAWS